jgi:hypothetical protein
MSRAALRLQINSKSTEAKDKIIALLKEQSFIATTCDCWSTYGKLYIGVTVHWIDDALQRKSACLTLRRMNGSHTFDAIAAVLDKIHAEFDIRRKIICTTTDNGSNFIKAFSVFAEKQEMDVPSSGNNGDGSDDNDSSDDESSEDVVGFEIDAVFTSDSDDREYHLPRHQRCACHTLNLITTNDINDAEQDPAYKKLSRAAFSKCQDLWNKYGRSALAVDIVMDAFRLGLKRSNTTRWNSVFLAVERLMRLIDENGEDAFYSVCTKLDMPRLKPPELFFLNEYVSVVRPLAQALNILQAENKMFMGYLLPTVVMLREKMATKKSSATTCKPLITAMINGIDRRFHDVFNDAEASAAAILHPKFKMSWTNNTSMIDSGLQDIRHQLATSTSTTVSDLSMASESGSSDQDEEDRFFAREKVSVSDEDILMQYLQDASETMDNITAAPCLKKLFIQLNTTTLRQLCVCLVAVA